LELGVLVGLVLGVKMNMALEFYLFLYLCLCLFPFPLRWGEGALVVVVSH